MFHIFAFQNESIGKNIPVFCFIAVEIVQGAAENYYKDFYKTQS